MTTWECSDCSTKNRTTARFCDQCGSPSNPALSSPTSAAAHGEPFTPPWERPGFQPSRPEDPCTEPGCTLTVRQHMDEGLRLTERVMLKAITL